MFLGIRGGDWGEKLPFGASMLATWVNLRTVGFLGALGANMGQLGANLEPTWGQLGANLGQLGANLGQLGANLVQLGAHLGVFLVGATRWRVWPQALG